LPGVRTTKPELLLTAAVAQTIVERIEPGLRVVGLVELDVGDISRVYEVKLASGYRPSTMRSNGGIGSRSSARRGLLV
jgi:hypothetical protein